MENKYVHAKNSHVQRTKFWNNSYTRDVAYVIDLCSTRLKQALVIAETKILLAKEQRKKIQRIQAQFIKNMEHDLRTPCCGLYGMLEYLSKKEPDPEKKKIFEMLSNAMQKLLDILDNILNVARLETHRAPVSYKPFDIRTLVDKLIALEKPAAIGKGLELQTMYADLPKTVCGDRFRLQKILLNLLGNAIKFTDKGSVTMTVKRVPPYKSQTKKGSKKTVWIQFKVQDTGIGIAEHQQKNIFEKFVRLNPSNQGRYKGLGLGLYLVQKLVRVLKGSITVESSLGKGATFICTIPFKRPSTL